MNFSEYIWPITVLIIFLGMLAIVWRALGIAHDLAKTVLASQQPKAPPVAVSTQPKVPSPVQVSPLPPVPAPAPTPVIDEGLIEFVKKEEGFRAKPYWDYKQWSVGYGTRASGPNDVVDEAEGERRLIDELNKANALVKHKYPNLPKGVEQALTDLTYNAGPGWEESTLGQRVAEGKWDSVKADILLYNHAGGQVNAGLTARREAEVKWIDNPL